MGQLQAFDHVDPDIDEFVDTCVAQHRFSAGRLSGEIETPNAGGLQRLGRIFGFGFVTRVRPAYAGDMRARSGIGGR